MKKLLASAVAALALTVTANVASAEEQDVAKIKCSEFLQSGSTMPLLIMWIDGSSQLHLTTPPWMTPILRN